MDTCPIHGQWYPGGESVNTVSVFVDQSSVCERINPVFIDYLHVILGVFERQHVVEERAFQSNCFGHTTPLSRSRAVGTINGCMGGMKYTETWNQIDRPYLYGKETKLANGLIVEVVRVDGNDWNMFLVNDTRNVVAISVNQYRKFGYADADRASMVRLAEEFFQ